jgi:uncharacterized coiled-coil protein SlyX
MPLRELQQEVQHLNKTISRQQKTIDRLNELLSMQQDIIRKHEEANEDAEIYTVPS